MEDRIAYFTHKLAFEIDAYDLHIALKKNEGIVVLDVRSIELFDADHIVGATHLPYRMIDELNTAGWGKDVLYIAYSDGIGCSASTKAALKLAMLGFVVKELQGGIASWKHAEYETERSNKKEFCCGRGCGC